MPYETDRLTAPPPYLKRRPRRHQPAPATDGERHRVPLSWLRRDHTPLPYESDRLAPPRQLERPRPDERASATGAARARPPINWGLVAVWATVLLVSLATWFALVMAVVALV
jgi:hypothetical protein